jgi:5'-deoxynucleotidase YfbR-like HD superfamily hydrolase
VNLFEALNGNIRRLRHVNRYSAYPCLKPESVAEHLWQVTFICLLIGYDLRRRFSSSIKMEILLAKAATHDISECMSGDIIRTYKYSSDEMRAACEAADRFNMGVLMEDFEEVSHTLYSIWAGAKSDTIEGDIVRFADLVAVVIYCAEEWHLGNTQLDATLERAYRNTIAPYHDHELFGLYVEQMFPSKNYRDAYRLDSAYGNEHNRHVQAGALSGRDEEGAMILGKVFEEPSVPPGQAKIYDPGKPIEERGHE